MERMTVIGLDIAKSVFQLHGVDADGEVVVRRRLRQACFGPGKIARLEGLRTLLNQRLKYDGCCRRTHSPRPFKAP